MQDHSQVMRDVVNEKADIDQRTTALEAAIAKLMQALPEETRDALSGSEGLESLGINSQGVSGAGASNGVAEMGEGMQWGAGGDDGLDLDNFLSQYGESPLKCLGPPARVCSLADDAVWVQ